MTVAADICKSVHYRHHSQVRRIVNSSISIFILFSNTPEIWLAPRCRARGRWLIDDASRVAVPYTSSPRRGFDPPVHKWNPSERVELIAELGAAFFLLYAISLEDVAYILTTFQAHRPSRDEPELFVRGAPILDAYDRLIET